MQKLLISRCKFSRNNSIGELQKYNKIEQTMEELKFNVNFNSNSLDEPGEGCPEPEGDQSYAEEPRT